MKRITQAERLAHIQSWRSSGLSRPKYCHESGIKYSTFLSWFKQEVDQNSTGRFVALDEMEEYSGQLTIIFSNGIRVEYGGTLSERLIQILQNV
jgi:hypothetical protein